MDPAAPKKPDTLWCLFVQPNGIPQGCFNSYLRIMTIVLIFCAGITAIAGMLTYWPSGRTIASFETLCVPSLSYWAMDPVDGSCPCGNRDRSACRNSWITTVTMSAGATVPNCNGTYEIVTCFDKNPTPTEAFTCHAAIRQDGNCTATMSWSVDMDYTTWFSLTTAACLALAGLCFLAATMTKTTPEDYLSDLFYRNRTGKPGMTSVGPSKADESICA